MADFIPTILVFIGWALLIPRLIQWANRRDRMLLWLSFALHEISAIGMVLMNRYYYEGGDMLGYELFGTYMSERMRDDFFAWFLPVLRVIFQRPDPLPLAVPVLGGATGSMEGFAAVLMFLCHDSLFAGCALVAGAAFVSKVAVSHVMRAELPWVPSSRILVGTLLVPSAVFWSSGMLKEPIAIIGLGMMIFGGHCMVATGNRLSGAAALGAGAVLVALLKPYLLLPFGAGAGLWYYLRSTRRSQRRSLTTRIGYGFIGVCVAVGLVLILRSVAPEYAPDQAADEAIRQQIIGARLAGGSNYSLGSQAGTSGGQLALVPFAVITALFRPVIFEANSALVLFGAIEMTIVTIFFVRALFRRSLRATVREVLRHPALGFCAAFTLTLSVGVGLGSTNLGTLSRYRMPLMPFFATLLLALTTRAASPKSVAAREVSPVRPLPRQVTTA